MAENPSERKMSFRKALSLTRRGATLVRQTNHGYLGTVIASTVTKALCPYVTIFGSARILSELAGQRRSQELVFWVLLTLLGTLACALLAGVLDHRKAAKESLSWSARYRVFHEKFLNMDFPDVDSVQTHDLYAQILQNDNWNGCGLRKIPGLMEKGLGGLAGILGALTLTVSLFTQPVPDGKLSFLNNEFFLLGFVLLLLAGALIPPALQNKSGEYWAKGAAEGRMGNRFFNFFGVLAFKQRHRALDIRIYEQEKIITAYSRKNNAFALYGYFSRMFRGPMGLLNAAAVAFSAIVIGLVYVFVCLKAWAGAFDVGQVVQYIGSITALSAGLSNLLGAVGDLRNNAPFLEKTFELLDIPNKMYHGSLTTEKRNDRQYDIEFRDVSFKYPGTDIWALRHVNMKLRVGSRLAVVGENGSGKTTFIKLLCRLYDPDEGEILLNGIDIRKYNYKDYVSLFSVVFQDFQLLSQPLGSNVAGRSQVDESRAIQALQDAGFGDRLALMPNGLETFLYRDLSADGVEISGGEAQKIAIARALYKNAPFIILDEPTASLDPIAEAEIYSKFSEITGDKTSIFISHRLSSCRFCEEIIVFDHGRVVQRGSHESLLGDEGGKYYMLWNAQAQYYTSVLV